MPLIYECDHCGVQRQDTRIPDAWRVFWRQGADRMGYACSGCSGSPSEAPRRRERAPAKPPDDGGLFGGKPKNG